ncbi:beta-ketoacyl-ACP synthase [Chitinibacteraceae bacterium HSL-7]
MIYLSAPGIVCALGDTLATVREHVFAGEAPGLYPSSVLGRELMLGHAEADLPVITERAFNTRNNRLLAHAFGQIAADYAVIRQGVPAARIAVIIGTSTSGIAEGEAAMREHLASGAFPAHYDYAQQELGSPAAWLARHSGAQGPAYVISTACSSGAKALAAASRLIEHGLADVVLAGGVDSLADFTIAGFSALESVSAGRCLPSGLERCGINIGEGAALFIVSRTPSPVRLSGYGESSDGHHISAPDPAGTGAELAIRAALRRADLTPAEIGYINLHGTATRQNDAMEHCVIHRVFGAVAASSTKALTGHTLGAAGAIEAALCWITLTDDTGRLPPHVSGPIDPELAPLDLVAADTHATIRAALSTSFAFGGNNAALILERT